MAVCYVFAKHRNPSKMHLSTASLKLFDNYTEFLFGPTVWAQATLDEHGNPVACPHIGHVLAYDEAMRVRAAELMNAGSDIESAFLEVRKDKEIKTVSFHNSVAISITSKACMELSAPSFQDRPHRSVRSEGKGSEGPRASDKPAPSPASAKTEKAKAKRLKKKAKEADLKAALKAANARAAPPAPHLATRVKSIKNGGVGDDRKRAKGSGKMKDKTEEGKSICFNWNRGAPCHTTPCPHLHICRVCESSDHTGPNCTTKK